MKGLAGSLLGALLTLLGWKLFGVTELAPRLGIAFVAFLIGHGVQRLVMGKPGPPPPAKTSSSNVPLIVAGVAAVVIALVVVLKWMELRTAERAMRAREEVVAAVPSPVATAVKPAPQRPSSMECDRLLCGLTGPATPAAVKKLELEGPGAALAWLDVRDEDLATAAALTAVQHLTIELHEGVTNASALGQLTALRSLRINRTLPSSLSFLASMPALETLQLPGPIDISVGLEVDRLSGKYPETDSRFAILKALPARRVDLAPLTGLKALKTLDFSGRGVFDLTPLSGLTALETLQMNGVPVADVAALGTLTSLKKLSTAKLPARDLSPLGSLVSLEELDLEAAVATDYAFVARLKKLTTLDLAFAQLSDLAPIAELPSLIRLEVDYTKVKSWSPLASFASRKTLENLKLHETSFDNVALLAGFTNLKVLTVPTGVSLTEYRKTHPKLLPD